MKNDSGQAITEYTIVMLGLMVLMWGTFRVFEGFQSGAFLKLLGGFGAYADSYDLILSLPFP